MAAAKPLHKIRAGQVSCALWENELNLSGGRKVTTTCGLDLSGWVLDSATAISADGTVLVGTDGSRAWVAVVPEPATLWLLSLVGLLAFQRKHRCR
jgi:hypothetical protein